MAKFDEEGNLITAPKALKSLYLEHYIKRLQHRSIMKEYSENFDKKVLLWDLRFDQLKLSKSEDWTNKELRFTLKSLKSNKTRDPSGFINELFKPGVIGVDLENAILQLINGIKREFYIPYSMQMANITTIYKKKGSRHDLENDRGIFGLSVFRKIIDKMVYKEKYPHINRSMSDSKIGARRNGI